MGFFLTFRQKDTDEYWRKIVSDYFASEAVMILSLPKEGEPDPKFLGRSAIAKTFKALWMSGVATMCFSLDGAREYPQREPGGLQMYVLHCPQARWRMHYYSQYMVELHGTLKVVCTLSNGGRAWRVQIQRFVLECDKEVTWLAKTAFHAASFRGPPQLRPMVVGTPHGVGPDADNNRFLRHGEVLVPATPVIRHGLPELAIRTVEVCYVLFFCMLDEMTDGLPSLLDARYSLGHGFCNGLCHNPSLWSSRLVG